MFDTLEEARENLREREGTAATPVDAVRVNDKDAPATLDARTAVRSWLKSQSNLEAAVWTALSSNWEKVRGRGFSPDDAVRYLSELERNRDEGEPRYGRACEYVRNTPDQIQTDVRKMLQARKEFKAATLPVTLFEQG